ncbi:hypothetical protein EWH99_05755 [Sporolactobacillus sp. THM7-7]|nr:hypothetical protein EWH99_05755 [Sporolactobacillus sp. THM7-7]
MVNVTYNGKTGYVSKENLADHAVDYTNTYGVSHITRYDISRIPSQQDSLQFKVPKFDAQKISNIPSAKKQSDEENPIDLDVWDSWPLQNQDGTVADYHGYHIVFALAGQPKTLETFIYVFYQKIGETSIESWKNAGRVFGVQDSINSNDPYLSHQTEEWSGSAVKLGDEIRLFYTDYSGAGPVGTGDSNQVLTTAKVHVSLDDGQLKIAGTDDHKSVFPGDGKFYQNVSQFHDEGLWNSGDNFTLRDPHYVEDNGHKYLVFEGNTGTEDGYQGELSLYNKAYYGGDDTFFKTEQHHIFLSPKKKLATLANGALGIIELNDDFSLKKVLPPLVTANLVTDEIERANVFKLNGKWYLFTDTRGGKMALDSISSDMIYMLGYVSDNLTGPYKPLNQTGLVLSQNENWFSRTWTYSYFNLLPSDPTDKNVVVTSYMTNRSISDTDHSTFAPSFLLTIDGDKTQVRQNDILEQGQLTNDGSDDESTTQPVLYTGYMTKIHAVRTGQSDKTKKIGEVKPGDPVQVLVPGKWTKILYKGQTAYVYGDITKQKPYTGYMTKIHAVRTGQSDKTKKIGEVKPGEAVRVLVPGKWTKILYHGKTAYVYGDITKQKPYAGYMTKIHAVRTGQSDKTKKIGEVKPGEAVRVLVPGKWTKILYHGKTAYVYGDITKQKPYTGYMTKIHAVRTGQSDKTKKIGEVKPGEAVRVLIPGKWTKILYHGKTAYVYHDISRTKP